MVTGPTGSGKSTTLYTALSELKNTEDINIITVEDPVEANLDGVNQVQVNAKADMTFASALRSILRQDPDIIMIGEIRRRRNCRDCGTGFYYRTSGSKYPAYQQCGRNHYPNVKYGRRGISSCGFRNRSDCPASGAETLSEL